MHLQPSNCKKILKRTRATPVGQPNHALHVEVDGVERLRLAEMARLPQLTLKALAAGRWKRDGSSKATTPSFSE